MYAADFETTTDPNDCRVWAYALCNIDDPDEFIYGNNIEEFFDFCAESKENLKIWFHNLKFDSAFILYYLLTHSFTYIQDRKDKKDFTFTTLITDMGQFYSLEVYFSVKGHKVKKVSFFDSLKIFPNMSVDKVAKGFGLSISKLELDYKTKREKGHELTQHEIDYIRNDVEIMARALKEMFNRGLTKMTIASDALTSFKEFNPYFRRTFPVLPTEVDSDIRMSYRGGFTYVNPIYAEKEIGKGMTLDVNSLYPSRMVQEYLPYGKPEYFDGKYQDDPSMPLFIQAFVASFRLKKGKIPNIQIKNHLSFIPNEYVESSHGQIIALSLCKPDFELFLENYDIDYIKYQNGWKFKSKKGIFDDYINHWMKEKIEASKEKNAAKRQIAKLMLNSLYGKFGLSTKCGQKAPVADENGVVRFVNLPPEERKPLYIPVACFITSYGRCKTIRTAEAIRDYSLKKYGQDAYLYSDTDSIHAMLTDADLEELKDIIDVDDYKLGAWSKESEFTRAIFIRQKCYIEEIDGELNVVVAGLPKYLAPIITFETFKKGFTTAGMSQEDLIELARKNGASEEQLKKLHHKLTYKYVEGGVILSDTDFTIK